MNLNMNNNFTFFSDAFDNFQNMNNDSSVLIILGGEGKLGFILETFNYLNSFIFFILFFCYYIISLYFYFKFLEFKYTFIETEGLVSTQLVDFFNLIVVLLIFIFFLLAFWISYILIKNRFKSLDKNFLLNFNSKFFFFFYNLFKITQNLFINRLIFLSKKNNSDYLDIADASDYPLLESTWSFIPLFFVSGISYPTVSLEYNISPEVIPGVIVRVEANQWFWNVEVETDLGYGLIDTNNVDNYFNNYFAEVQNILFKENNDIAFNELTTLFSYNNLKKEISVNLNELGDRTDLFFEKSYFRLLLTNNTIYLPVNIPVLILLTSVDVIHSLALPAFFIKADAVPGRISKVTFMATTPGIYFGQCSELCGPFHGFMPITFEAVSFDEFIKVMSE